MQLRNSANPWFTIWTAPRDTIQSIVDRKPSLGLLPLAMLYGLPLLLQLAQSLSLGMRFKFIPLLLGCLVLSPIAGYIGFAVAAFLLKWTGRLMKGQGSYEAIRAAFAWSNVPNIGALFGWVILLFRFHSALFLETFGKHPFSGSDLWLTTSAFLLQAIFTTWSLIILVVGLATVQRFSILRAIGNLILPFMLLLFLSWILLAAAGQG